MPSSWFREYRDAVAPQWVRWTLAAATVVGGVAGVYYLAQMANVNPLVASLALLLLVSVALNVRQALVWKRQHDKALDAAAMSKRWRKQSDQWKRMYEDEEQSRWTSSQLVVEHRELPPSRMNRPHGVQVAVGTMLRLEGPIRLRFWFSRDVEEDPSVWFLRDYTHHSSAEVEEARNSGHGSARVYPGGRVDVEWDSGSPLADNSRVFIAAYAAEHGEEIRLHNVQRRYIES